MDVFLLFLEMNNNNNANIGGGVSTRETHGSVRNALLHMSKNHHHNDLLPLPLCGITPCGIEYTLKILNNSSVFA